VAAALASYNSGDLAAAATNFSLALALDPLHRDASYNLGSLLLALGRPLLAVPHFKRCVLIDPTDRTASHVLGGVLGDLEPTAVAAAYAEVVACQPENSRAKHMLATLTGEGEASQGAAHDYVREIFDELSEEFEDKLVKHLEYQVPWQLLEAVDEAAGSGGRGAGGGYHPDGSWRVLDLGCGSGLCGRLFRKYTNIEAAAKARGEAGTSGEANAVVEPAGGRGSGDDGHMVGVDLSPKMIDISKQKGGYDELIVDDVHAAIEMQPDAGLQLLLSADTFIYVGDLDRCFDQARKKLADGGLFAFSVERLEQAQDGAAAVEPAEGRIEDAAATSAAAADGAHAGFKLQRSGRYAHSHEYVAELAKNNGMVVEIQREVVVRKEQATPIPGLCYVLRKVVS